MLSVDHCGDLGGCDGLISPLWSSELHGIQSYINHIGGVIVSMFTLSMVDCGFISGVMVSMFTLSMV